MIEENIRPKCIMDENAVLHKKDMEKLFRHRNLFEEIACPACESSCSNFAFEKDAFTFVTCSDCETVFVNPRPTPNLLADFYMTSESFKHWNDEIFPASEEYRRKEIFSPRATRVAELCEKNKVGTNIIVDVGAGFGTFCEEIKKKNIFDYVYAVEPSHDLAKTCHKKGIDVIEKPIEDVDLGNINVITNFELIEHLYSPKNFLMACEKALPKGGMIILTTPNIKGFDMSELRQLSDHIAGPNHLNYFHAQSLGMLMERCGFEVVESFTPGKLDAEIVRKKILTGDLDVPVNGFLNQVLIEKWDTLGDSFQEFLSENGLSSHLWMVAKKMI